MAFVQSLLSGSVGNDVFTGGSTNYVVETDAGVMYQVYIDINTDVMFTKSTDSGKTWDSPVTVFTGTATKLAVWADWWSGIAGSMIHCAYSDNDADDVFYRSIDTASADALGTQRTIFAGATASAGSAGISITRTRGGNLICVGTIDNGTENFAKKSTDAGVNWTNIAAVMESGAGDMVIMAPGFAADDEDAMCFFWDASADEISVKFYDDSGDSWSEVSIATTMVELAASTAYPNWSAAVDLTNSYVLLAAWSAADLANADLRIWTVNEAAQTELTNVVTNSTDDQGYCGVSLDTTNGDIYVIYAGKTDGTETFSTQLNLYYKLSTDDGVTWGAETRLTPGACSILGMYTNPRMVYLSAELVVMFSNLYAADTLAFISISPTLPTAAQVQSGVTFGINGNQLTGTYTGSDAGAPGFLAL